MKLGLLAVVAVAVLLPSFSDSRIVSKCELRDKLRDKLQKNNRVHRRVDDATLAKIICEVHRKSHLDTSLVRVFGSRVTTTPKPAVTTVPSTTGASTKTTAATLQPTSTSSATTQMINTTTASTANTTTANTTTIITTTTNTTATNTTGTNTTTTNTTNTNTTGTNTTTTNTTNTNTTGTNTTATNLPAYPATTNSTISSMNTTLVSNSTGRIRRQKREVNSDSGEEMAQYSSPTAGSEGDVAFIMNPWSLGLYGLFQLSDGEFCDSGYRQSQNECHTSCTAFTDDDISDDIACFVNTDYWRQIIESASGSCGHTSNFFKECK